MSEEWVLQHRRHGDNEDTPGVAQHSHFVKFCGSDATGDVVDFRSFLEQRPFHHGAPRASPFFRPHVSRRASNR